MYTLYVLWWIPDDGAWEHGWKDYSFSSESAAIDFCKKYLEGIECAEIRESGACIVSDGKLTEEVCVG
jgi:hypothetical protein